MPDERRAPWSFIFPVPVFIPSERSSSGVNWGPLAREFWKCSESQLSSPPFLQLQPRECPSVRTQLRSRLPVRSLPRKDRRSRRCTGAPELLRGVFTASGLWCASIAGAAWSPAAWLGAAGTHARIITTITTSTSISTGTKTGHPSLAASSRLSTPPQAKTPATVWSPGSFVSWVEDGLLFWPVRFLFWSWLRALRPQLEIALERRLWCCIGFLQLDAPIA